MFGESLDPDFDAPKDEITSVPDIITDLVGDAAMLGIPAPVRRNLFKAIGQLSSAVIDIPVAYLEGIADERRAETAARIRLTNRSAEQIAQQMQTDPEYARVAAQKFGNRVIREQVNLDLISQKAASEIRDAFESTDQSGRDQSDDTVNDDWLNAFETEARLKSTEEMQTLFGKILAGEIRKPGSYSTRTVRILGSLDQSVANHFMTLCSMCISAQFQDIRASSLGGNASDNALKEYGLDFATLNLLNEYGLIIAEYNSWYEFMPCVPLPGAGEQAVCFPLSYLGKHCILMPLSADKVGKTLRVHGVALTNSGRELFKIVGVRPIEKYSEELAQFLKRGGYRMTRVDGGEPRVVRLDFATGRDSQ